MEKDGIKLQLKLQIRFSKADRRSLYPNGDQWMMNAKSNLTNEENWERLQDLVNDALIIKQTMPETNSMLQCIFSFYAIFYHFYEITKKIDSCLKKLDLPLPPLRVVLK